MKKFFLIITITMVLIANITYGANIKDINNHWAKAEIEESISNDIISGYEDNTFRPNEGVTLAEYLKIIIKSAKFDLVREGSYWPDYFIKTALTKGLILENEFDNYNKKLTRNEIARITARYINVEDVKKSNNKLKDLSSEYKEDIQKLVKLNVIKGYEDNTFRGENNVTRAEAIVIAKRATKTRRDLIIDRKYTEEEKIKYSNIKTANNQEESYEIKNSKLYIYDYGKYSNLQNYEIKDEFINVQKSIKTIDSLIDEDSYTEVLYVPFEKVINQLLIRCGENKNVTSLGGFDFEITYYENKPYELKRITKEKIFSEECYMKIEIGKMWREAESLNKQKYVDEYKKEKLRKCLEIEFGIKHEEKILEYMLEKYIAKITRKTQGVRETEQKVFGSFVLNYYKKEDGNPVFFVSKIK